MLKQKLGIIGIIGTRLPLLLLTSFLLETPQASAATLAGILGKERWSQIAGGMAKYNDLLNTVINVFKPGLTLTEGTELVHNLFKTAGIKTFHLTGATAFYTNPTKGILDFQLDFKSFVANDQVNHSVETKVNPNGTSFRKGVYSADVKLTSKTNSDAGPEEDRIVFESDENLTTGTQALTGEQLYGAAFSLVYLDGDGKKFDLQSIPVNFQTIAIKKPPFPPPPPQACVPGGTGGGRSFTYSLVHPNVTTGVASDAIDSSLAPKFPGTISAIKNFPSTPGTLSVNSGGTGVFTPPPAADLGGGNVGKNATNQEALRITIPPVPGVAPAYRLVSATFSNLLSPSSSRQFGISVDNKSCTFNVENPGSTITVSNPTGSLAGTNFDFFVVNNDGRFRMTSATFETVPEPLTILGTGFAAAALPALKRVHKKAKK